jgi:hypothetical protein
MNFKPLDLFWIGGFLVIIYYIIVVASLKKESKQKPVNFFWLVVFLLLIYNFFIPLQNKNLDIGYSCIIIANDAPGTIIGTINAISFQKDTLRKVNIPDVEKIPLKIREAVLASEDRSFFKSWRTYIGFNW